MKIALYYIMLRIIGIHTINSHNVCIVLVYFGVQSSGHIHNCFGVVVSNDVTNAVIFPAAGLSCTCFIKVGEFL